MTDMEKKVMVRLCAKILTETELYGYGSAELD